VALIVVHSQLAVVCQRLSVLSAITPAAVISAVHAVLWEMRCSLQKVRDLLIPFSFLHATDDLALVSSSYRT
jgi:hypothetical protein